MDIPVRPRAARRLASTVASLAAVLALVACGLFAAAPASADSDDVVASLFQPFSWSAFDAIGSEAQEGAEPAVCTGCTPPLNYAGGTILGTPAQAGVLTITPIYWAPPGTSFLGAYKTLVNQYITDIAADSGRSTNVFAVNAEYSRAAGPGSQIVYALIAGTPINDSTPFPSPGCVPSAGYTRCVTEAQITARIEAQIAASGGRLTADLAHIYPVFLPDGVDVANSGGHHAAGAFCGYHGAYVSAAGPVVFAVEDYPVEGCFTGQYPAYGLTGDVDTAAADSEVGTLSHEINEAITDPQLSLSYGWYDRTGHEIGDECAETFGPPLGSTNTSDATQTQQTAYNQVINGHKYYTQLSFSNATFAKFGMGQGCVGKAFAPQGAADPTVAAPHLTKTRASVSPSRLPADGKSKSTVTMSVTHNNGEPVVGDNVTFNVTTAEGGEGECGTLTDADGDPEFESAMTDSHGEASVTYTASTDQVMCDVIASDFESGTSEIAVLDQGSDGDDMPRLDGVLPTTLTAGGAPVTFDLSVSNPSEDELANARVTLYVGGDDAARSGLKASQVHLSYADDGTGGAFVNLPLSGETIDGGTISGFAGPEDGGFVAAQDSSTTTFKLSLDASVASSAATDAKLKLEADLDQVNPAAGSTDNLDDIGPAFADVLPAPAVAAATPVATPTPTTITKVVTVTAPPAAVKPCTVPKLVGKTYASAKTKLKAAGCAALTIVIPSGKTPKGRKLVVGSLSPKAGTRVTPGRTIRVTLKRVRV